MENDTTKKILQASLEVFSRDGYTGATTKEIAATAGVAEITLFRYYGTKYNLFMESIKEYLAKPMLEIDTGSDKCSLRGLLEMVVQKRIKTISEHRRLFFCAIYESQFKPEVRDMMKLIHSNILKALVDLFHQKLNEENLKDLDIEFISDVFLSIVVGKLVTSSISDENSCDEDLERLSKEISELILNGISNI